MHGYVDRALRAANRPLLSFTKGVIAITPRAARHDRHRVGNMVHLWFAFSEWQASAGLHVLIPQNRR